MLPDENPEIPDVEDIHDDNQSDAGHAEPADDEIDGGESDGDEGDRAEDDLEDDSSGADEGQEDGQAEVAARGRGNRQFGELRAQRRAAEEKAQRLEAELNAERLARQRAAQAEDAAAEKARLELMSPDEKVEYLLRKQETGFRNEIQQLRYENWENADRLAFRSLCADNPAIAAIAEEVEQARAAAARNGQTPSREAVAYWLIGQKAVSRAKGAKTKQAKRGQQNLDRQRVKAPAGGSDRAAEDRRGGGNSRSALRKRLEGVKF